MAEDHLYWFTVYTRWVDDANFDNGPRVFFKAAPAPIRPLVTAMVRRQVRKALRGQGTGRHSATEVSELGSRSLQAISDYLDGKPFFMGPDPAGVDATIFAFVVSAMCPLFTSPLQQAAASHDNLRSYVGRMTARFYPELGEIAGCKAAA
jgi:glutathione S-transferase